MKKIALDKENNIKISVARGKDGKITRGIVLEDTLMQDAYLALLCLQGECKNDPIVGCNLFRKVRGKADKVAVRKEIKIALRRVGIRLEDIKDNIQTLLDGTTI